MQDYYIAFSSVTFAMRVRDQFKYDGSHISLLHTPKAIPVNGCSYSLRCKEGKISDIVNKAHEMKILVKGVFKKSGDVFVEVAT